DLPPVRGDRALLQHAIENLIDNAVKHGESGRQLSIKLWSDGSRVHMRVADRGPGIRPDDLPHIFKKFYRGSSATHPGSGLGLAIIQRIVHEHGGTIDIATAPGEGTAAHLSLPISSARTMDVRAWHGSAPRQAVNPKV